VSGWPVPARDLLTPARVASAAGIVRDGIVHDLGLTLDAEQLPPTDGRSALPMARIDVMTPDEWRAAFGGGQSGFHLDAISGSIHHGTHIDGLVHIVHEGAVFGGLREREVRSAAGWSQHGAETIPAIVGRGVIIDLVLARGGRALEGSHEITPGELDAACRETDVSLKPGDVVLVRTGKLASLPADREHFLDRQPGIGVDAAIWLAERGMAAFGSDTAGTEPQPVTDWARTVHVELLTRRGIHLFEWLDLDGLAASGRREFLFVAAPLKLRGASGAWVRPVAIS
jgi:kynurenine formamidase